MPIFMVAITWKRNKNIFLATHGFHWDSYWRRTSLGCLQCTELPKHGSVCKSYGIATFLFLNTAQNVLVHPLWVWYPKDSLISFDFRWWRSKPRLAAFARFDYWAPTVMSFLLSQQYLWNLLRIGLFVPFLYVVSCFTFLLPCSVDEFDALELWWGRKPRDVLFH